MSDSEVELDIRKDTVWHRPSWPLGKNSKPEDIYKKMNLRGICRIDYIIMNDIPYIIEINTIPGLSEESIIPQQLKSAKLKLSEIFETCLLNTK